MGDPMIELDRLGARLSVGRQAQHLSQRELARRIGVSASLISQIETGKVRPSVATLMAIVGELGLSIDETLLAVDKPAVELDIESSDSHMPLNREPVQSIAPAPHPPNDGSRGSIVQLGAHRARIELSSGVQWERLTASSDSDVDFILATYPPGASSSEGDQLLSHTGREYWFVMSGVLSVQLVFDKYHAGPNDSFSFDCALPHQFRNEGDVTVSAVVTVVRSATAGH